MVAVGGEMFRAVGLMVREKNWLQVYTYQSWGDQREMPNFNPGQTFRPIMDLKQGMTQPPPRLTERDLLSKMESYGIGTDATIAEHISKQLDRGYAVKGHDLTFSPTGLGEALIGSYRWVFILLERSYFLPFSNLIAAISPPPLSLSLSPHVSLTNDL